MERKSVIKTELNRKGEKVERKMTLDTETIRRIQKRPEVFGVIGRINPLNNVKYEVLKTPPKVEKEPEVAEYTEENYRKDLDSGNIFFKEGEKEKAFECYNRAYLFKKSPYIKGKMNKCQ